MPHHAAKIISGGTKESDCENNRSQSGMLPMGAGTMVTVRPSRMR